MTRRPGDDDERAEYGQPSGDAIKTAQRNVDEADRERVGSDGAEARGGLYRHAGAHESRDEHDQAEVRRPVHGGLSDVPDVTVAVRDVDGIAHEHGGVFVGYGNATPGGGPERGHAGQYGGDGPVQRLCFDGRAGHGVRSGRMRRNTGSRSVPLRVSEAY